MSKLGTVCRERSLRIQCVAKNEEDYLGLSVMLAPSQKPKRKAPTSDEVPTKKRKTNAGAQFIDDMAADPDDEDMDEELNMSREETLENLIGGGYDQDGGEPITGEKKGRMWKLRFIDTKQFLNASLESLVNNSKGDLPITKNHFRQFPHLLPLVTRKDVYPYDYMNDFAKMDDTSLPPIEEFYSQLYDEPCTSEDYAHVWTMSGRSSGCKRWKTITISISGSTFYCWVMFENFRQFALSHYGLDPLHDSAGVGLGCLYEIIKGGDGAHTGL